MLVELNILLETLNLHIATALKDSMKKIDRKYLAWGYIALAQCGSKYCSWLPPSRSPEENSQPLPDSSLPSILSEPGR